jgi:hypothetical protein
VNLQENIRKILREDTGLKTRLENMMKNKGIIITSKSVGGVTNLVNALGLDIDDLKTQEMLVKNFIYDIELMDVEISFLKVDRNRPDKVRIKIYFKTNLMASNMESWVISTFRDEMNKFFPFKSTAVYEPAFAGRNTKVVLDSEQIEESEDDDEVILENSETPNNVKTNLEKLIEKIGIDNAKKAVGGIENLIKILYDGDLKRYYKENDYIPFKISTDGMAMYIDDLLVQSLNLEDWSKKEKTLGYFGYGPKDYLSYKFTARLHSLITSNTKQQFWKVVGTSGDSGFGYSFITKRNTLGKRARAQIFQQIIDKYDLNSYI